MADKVFVSLNKKAEPVDRGNKLSSQNHFGVDVLVLR